jgi:hypothetical protein
MAKRRFPPPQRFSRRGYILNQMGRMNIVRFRRCRLCDQLRVDLSTRVDVGQNQRISTHPSINPPAPSISHTARSHVRWLSACARGVLI